MYKFAWYLPGSDTTVSIPTKATLSQQNLIHSSFFIHKLTYWPLLFILHLTCNSSKADQEYTSIAKWTKFCRNRASRLPFELFNVALYCHYRTSNFLMIYDNYLVHDEPSFAEIVPVGYPLSYLTWLCIVITGLVISWWYMITIWCMMNQVLQKSCQ